MGKGVRRERGKERRKSDVTEGEKTSPTRGHRSPADRKQLNPSSSMFSPKLGRCSSIFVWEHYIHLIKHAKAYPRTW